MLAASQLILDKAQISELLRDRLCEPTGNSDFLISESGSANRAGSSLNFWPDHRKIDKSGQKKGLAAEVLAPYLSVFDPKRAKNGQKGPNLTVFSRFCPKMAKNGEKWPNSGRAENAPGRDPAQNPYAKIRRVFDEEPPNSGGGKYSPLN